MSNAEKPYLRRANDNPWYCLATLYGEQATERRLSWNEDLAAKNRIAWNRWVAGGLSAEQRESLLKNDFPERELAPLTAAEKDDLCSAFALRIGREKELPPDPSRVVDFTNTNFDGAVNFDGFLFARDVDFASAKFCEYAGFKSARFSGRTDFAYATFTGHANFNAAVFSSAADFSLARFAGYSGFHSARFYRNADFNSAKFFGYADFRSSRFSGYIDFESATFFRESIFINAEFIANTVFAYTRFEINAPDFRGAKMHEATEWHGVHWPPVPEDEDEDVAQMRVSAQAQVYAYERLKQEMERLKKHEDEQFFFRKELRARRGLVSRWSGTWLLNCAYEVLSRYGQSILRPALWLLALFWFGIAVFTGFPVFEGVPMAIPRAAILSFANIFSFLPIKREIMTPEMIAGLSSAAQIVSVTQSLLGIVLLFLLGLALRSRFRMR
jgi:hypothetical protein